MPVLAENRPVPYCHREQIVYNTLPAVKARQDQDLSTMSKSSDERIQRHIQKQKDTADTQAQQAQRAVEERDRKNRFLADLRAKWANDTHIIVEILKDFGPKLDGQFHFMDLGAPPPNTAAHGRITGRIRKRAPISIDLTVDEQGRLNAVRAVNPAVRVPSTISLTVTDATREQYEDFILDLLNVEK